jgi:hypothetical protein
MPFPYRHASMAVLGMGRYIFLPDVHMIAVFGASSLDSAAIADDSRLCYYSEKAIRKIITGSAHPGWRGRARKVLGIREFGEERLPLELSCEVPKHRTKICTRRSSVMVKDHRDHAGKKPRISSVSVRDVRLLMLEPLW